MKDLETESSAYVSISDIRAVLSQIRSTQKVAGKTPTLLNIARQRFAVLGSIDAERIAESIRAVAPIIQEAISQGYACLENRAYYLTNKGIDLIFPFRRGGCYINEVKLSTVISRPSRVNRGTRVAVGTKSPRH